MTLTLLMLLAVLPIQQCADWTHNSHPVHKCWPYNAWVLEYHCDGGNSDRCFAPTDTHKEFTTKSELIDWAETNYRFSPDEAFHGGEYLDCRIRYLYPDADDEDRKLMKEVDCDTQENLDRDFPATPSSPTEGMEFPDL